MIRRAPYSAIARGWAKVRPAAAHRPAGLAITVSRGRRLGSESELLAFALARTARL